MPGSKGGKRTSPLSDVICPLPQWFSSCPLSYSTIHLLHLWTSLKSYNLVLELRIEISLLRSLLLRRIFSRLLATRSYHTLRNNSSLHCISSSSGSLSCLYTAGLLPELMIYSGVSYLFWECTCLKKTVSYRGGQSRPPFFSC